jgi:hypothetical protein
VTPLRGDTLGSFAETLKDPIGPVRQLLGKVYMVNRAVAALGDLGKQLAFESPVDDESLTRFLYAVEGQEEAASGETDGSANRSSLIKSLFRR